MIFFLLQINNKGFGLFFFKEAAVTGDTFLAMVNTGLRRELVEKIFHLNGVPLPFSRRVSAFDS